MKVVDIEIMDHVHTFVVVIKPLDHYASMFTRSNLLHMETLFHTTPFIPFSVCHNLELRSVITI